MHITSIEAFKCQFYSLLCIKNIFINSFINVKIRITSFNIRFSPTEFYNTGKHKYPYHNNSIIPPNLLGITLCTLVKGSI